MKYHVYLVWYPVLLGFTRVLAFVPPPQHVALTFRNNIGQDMLISQTCRTTSTTATSTTSTFGINRVFNHQSRCNHLHQCMDAKKSAWTSTSLSATLSTAVATAAATRGINSYFLVRIIFLRGLAFVYMTAFLIAFRQNKGLIGDNGITPAREILDHVEEGAREKRKRRNIGWQEQKTKALDNGNTMEPLPTYSGGILSIAKNTKIGRSIGDKLNSSNVFQNTKEVLWDRSDRLGRLYPTVLWFMSKEDRMTKMNAWLDTIAMSGMSISLAMFALGAANVPMLMGLWICQRSLMSVGGPFYGFGWEPQLAELTFHAMFMAPVLSLSQIPSKTPVPAVTLWAMRWFMFRIMIGAGLIKLRSGDPKWKFSGSRKLSTMDYFYETQPVPNPLTRYFHKMPKFWHRFEVLMNHFVELVSPWLLILPLGRDLRIAGGAIQLLFQSVLITSGNLRYVE